MTKSINNDLERRIGLSVEIELRKIGLDAPIQILRERLGDPVPLYLVGGFVRDRVRLVVEGRVTQSKDADIVVDADNLFPICAALPGNKMVTPLGGIRWYPPGAAIGVDIWGMKDTLWIRALNLSLSIGNVLAGFDLNVDRIAFGVHDKTVIDQGCITAVMSRYIDLDANVRLKNLLPFELVRAVIAHLKTGYDLSPRVATMLVTVGHDILDGEVMERFRAEGHQPQTLRRVCKFLHHVIDNAS